MKFIILKDNLKQGLAIVSHLTTRNINLPILNNVLIKAKKEGVEVVSTNLEISIEHFLRGKVEREGVFTVDSRIIGDYINLLPDEKIEIEQVEGDLKIDCKNHKTKIKGQSAEDFPVLPIISQKKIYYFLAEEIKNALSSVVFSTSSNESRAELSGVYFSFFSGALTLVGTDSYRLSEKKIKIKNKNEENFAIIVPSKTAQEVIRILNNFKTESQIEGGEEIGLSLSDNQIFFSIGGTKIGSRVIIGNYPDYKQIIPKTEKTKVIINRSVLLRAVKSVGIFSKTGINDINLNFIKNKTIISSSSSQAGESLVELECDIKGENNEVFVNYKYLTEGLNNMDSENVVLDIVDNNTPCVIRPEGVEDFLYLIMPIKQ